MRRRLEKLIGLQRLISCRWGIFSYSLFPLSAFEKHCSSVNFFSQRIINVARESCSSPSGPEPEKSTDNPSDDNVDDDDPETEQDQHSEIPKEETVNDQQVEADQEHGDDHQAEKEEMEEPTFSTPTRLQIECGFISSPDEETAEENFSHSSRKRERESSEEENEEQEQEKQGDDVEEQADQGDEVEVGNADQDSPENIPEGGGGGGGDGGGEEEEQEQEYEREVVNDRGKSIAEEEKKDDGALVDPETLQTIIDKSGGSDHYDDSDSRDIEILKAMLVYQAHEGRIPFNVELHELLKNSTEVEISEEELEMKYLVLQAKFMVIVEEKGEGHEFDRPYCQEMFSLSKSLWGSGLY